MWGANAMNGVINIVTKSAADTKGTSVAVSARHLRPRSGIGSPWRIARRAWRIGCTRSGPTTPIRAIERERRPTTSWNSLATGVRADWSRGGDAVMAQASFTTGESHPRWTRALQPFSRRRAVVGGRQRCSLEHGHGPVGAHSARRLVVPGAGVQDISVEGYEPPFGEREHP